MPKTMLDTPYGSIPYAFADVDATHKPSEVLAAVRSDILIKLKERRGKDFGPHDEALLLFDEIVAFTMATLARGRDY